MIEVPELWRDTLLKIREVFPTAIIAGGALRDLDYGKPVKDVDVFIPVGCFNRLNVELNLAELFPASINADHPQDYQLMDKGAAERYIYKVCQVAVEGTLFELVFCSANAADIYQFDFSICQVSYDGSSVRTTNEYDATKLTKVVKTINNQSDARKQKRIERLQAKFPELTIEQG